MKVTIQKPCSGKPFFLAYSVGDTVTVNDQMGAAMVAAGLATQVIEKAKPKAKPAPRKSAKK